MFHSSGCLAGIEGFYMIQAFNKTIKPVALKGTVKIPPSKSMAHRAILAAALADGESVIKNVAPSDDVRATMAAVAALGAQIIKQGDLLAIQGIAQAKKAQIDCGESGTTLRLVIPVLSALAGGLVSGRGRLPQRPLDEYLKIFEAQRLAYERDAAGLPLKVPAGLKSGVFTLSGKASSQYISGLMFALPLLTGDSQIIIADTLESSGYVDMTVEVLQRFGIEIEETEMHKRYTVHGNQQYKACEITVEGDWSQAAFYLLAGTLGAGVRITGLKQHTMQKDKGFLDLLLQMGADIQIQNDAVIVRKSSLKGITADVSQMPDIAPALAGAMAIAEGRSVITGGKRLRLKESDRIASVTQALLAIGAEITPTEDGMVIQGKPQLAGGEASGFNDHRIVMTLAALAPACAREVLIHDAQAVNKSYPSFFEDIKSLGGVVL
jgi:3-phosphoshikimate 1-carboxyvinyltransferase